MMSENLFFVLGDKLPTVYDAAIAIFSVATQPGSRKMVETIRAYQLALMNSWQKSFGPHHVMARSSVKNKLMKITKDYYNKVYNKAHRKSKKKKSSASREVHNYTIRSLNKEWRKTNDCLLEIGKDMKEVGGHEKVFYIDQQTTRKFRLSEEIDDDYVNEQFIDNDELSQQQEREQAEFDFAMGDEDPNYSDENLSLNSSVDTSLNFSINRSGHIRAACVGIEMATQTNSALPDRPKLRINKRVATDEIKSTCARISSNCGVSVETSRKAVQIVCKYLYGHDVYLTTKEQEIGRDNPDSSKCDYSYVIPSIRTITDYKQIQASEMERNAAIALYKKSVNIKVTIHFDSTGRSSIDGEWPSIILRFSDGVEYRLRPLFFAFEDRQQITELFVETLTRLAITLSVALNIDITPSCLWENIDAIMTDAVTKNLNIENKVADELASSHIPFHLLCKSHTVEALDKANLEVLSKIEKSVKQQDVFEKINPSLRSFFRGKKALVEAGIEALLTLITHDKSGKSCSQADLFDYICEREGVSKRVFLYQQRRFAKLGKAALSVLQAKDILQMLVNEVEGTNQLVESCKIYLSSELFITELECLAFFNHNITFPFLNFVEISSQTDLIAMIPQLYRDLSSGKTDTLKQFVISIHGITIPTLSGELSKKIVEMMCTSAAVAIKLQCGREYGFADGEKLRATNLSLLSVQELEGLPTNNLVTERDLSRFDREAKVAKSRNRKFKAKNIRNNMILYKTKKEIKLDKLSRKIADILSTRESVWNEGQQIKLKDRLEMKLKKCVKSKNYTRKLLENCKSWGGPCISIEELQQILKEKSDQAEHVVKTELAYYAHTHKADRIVRPDLFKLNGIPHEEKLVNLAILLEDEHTSTHTVADLPTNKDVICALNDPYSKKDNALPLSSLQVNQLCIVVWQNCDGRYEWHIAYVKGIQTDGYELDHLYRAVQGCNNKWKYPKKVDVQIAEKEQIVTCDVKGDWDITPDSRKRLFTLQNRKEIENEFFNHVK